MEANVIAFEINRHWKSGAVRLGISVEEYAAQRNSGRKWCYACKSFQPDWFFRGNSTKCDGKRSECNTCHNLVKHNSRKRGINSQGLTTIIRIPQRK